MGLEAFNLRPASRDPGRAARNARLLGANPPMPQPGIVPPAGRYRKCIPSGAELSCREEDGALVNLATLILLPVGGHLRTCKSEVSGKSAAQPRMPRKKAAATAAYTECSLQPAKEGPCIQASTLWDSRPICLLLIRRPGCGRVRLSSSAHSIPCVSSTPLSLFFCLAVICRAEARRLEGLRAKIEAKGVRLACLVRLGVGPQSRLSYASSCYPDIEGASGARDAAR